MRNGTYITLLLSLLVTTALVARSADTTLSVCGAVVSLRFPEKPAIGTVLMLPGWHYSQTDCCDHSSFCHQALAAGFALVMPAMNKSIYVRKHYPETRREWRSSPTLLWLVDTLIPSLQHTYRLLLPHQNNFLFGISTGARGAALCAEATGLLFRGAAMLSGDYDPLSDTGDRLMIGYLGPHDKFPDRWSGANNPIASASALTIPIYLGHGAKDGVVPARQSIAFFKKMQSVHPEIHSVLHIDTSGMHDYNYWGRESKNVLDFFLGHLKLKKERQQ